MSAITLSASNSLISMKREPRAQETQGIQTGNLIINNTLNEPVQWNVAMKLDGVIPGMGTIKNSSASMSGIIAANSQAPLSSGFFMGGNTWGSTINLTLRRTSGAGQLQRQLQRLGTYALTVDGNGHLTLEQQN